MMSMGLVFILPYGLVQALLEYPLSFAQKSERHLLFNIEFPATWTLTGGGVHIDYFLIQSLKGHC